MPPSIAEIQPIGMVCAKQAQDKTWHLQCLLAVQGRAGLLYAYQFAGPYQSEDEVRTVAAEQAPGHSLLWWRWGEKPDWSHTEHVQAFIGGTS